MDFIQKSGVKIPNAVVVSGITQVVEQDEQVIDFLKKYGKIERTQVALNRVTKRGGVTHKEVDKHLLKQFCRGC